ncbi:NAD(P)H-dependent FMN reductase [Mycena indigotica]|uniref:NAD(P)H-dependent FMN reductase n=1 Tax=Mycena indigotica TaxID=2126181 RepID=A0A8H6WG45_9AGAR|nr:NAD(P)H-dependent FMN reductase [Mycena indigotica]XP_037226468.1 NAD(P)H-dependent FMN reductase [Mycena indigotica]KAF7316442.1 NAD(P)H-dependent FMN reductase [Mycena indigotica]KAF7316445.1 NAD(P)H-dependent FMN reductase [Mycena indigotica]
MTRIALIIGSTRTPRIGPSIANVVLEIVKPLLPSGSTLEILDLKDHPVPMHLFDAPPAGVTPGSYPDAATNAWSAVISSFDAFIILTPQHNWGYPAVLKLALDALYHEWAKKPAVVISYGSHGGGKANAQLRQVLSGLRMRVCERFVELPFARGHDQAGAEIDSATNDRWRIENKKVELVQAWDAFMALCA